MSLWGSPWASLGPHGLRRAFVLSVGLGLGFNIRAWFSGFQVPRDPIIR